MSNPLHTLFDRDGFRLRGTEVTRIDAFSDVVFGFAVTLLVVSLEVPKTYHELHEMLYGFVPFAVSFVILIAVWLDHYRFFLRFGLHDFTTIRINLLLLFVVLFYVYPLKFLFSMLSSELLGMERQSPFSSPYEVRELMVLYGIGYAAIYALMALLNYQGWRQREALHLTAVERVLTQSYIVDMATVAGIGLLSCAVALILPVEHSGGAGLVYCLIGIHKTIHFRRYGRRVRKMQAALHDTEAAD